WFGDKYSTHVAKLDGKIVGAYVIRPNHRGELSNHIANAAYIVDSSQRGHGIGRALGEHSLQTA
ncbi:MAG: GNAT family N-acetyltransferase, partial [Alphaproteobacteria bacterium CG11_big_fil_rev_8_21_14_0_20_44_7]